MMQPFHLTLQNSMSIFMMEVDFFHDSLSLFMFSILVFVAGSLIDSCRSGFSNLFLLQGHLIENIWTFLPGVALLVVAYNSLMLIYMSDLLDSYEGGMTISVKGHQWYWSYERYYVSVVMPTFLMGPEMDVYPISEGELSLGQCRIMESDYRILIPSDLRTNFSVTSTDVLHSWSVPSLGIKMDACPGRVNSIQARPVLPGIYYGQCSEICGANHSFMPISVEAMPLKLMLMLVKSPTVY